MNRQPGDRLSLMLGNRLLKTLLFAIIVSAASETILTDNDAGVEAPYTKDTEKEDPTPIEHDDRTLLDMFGEVAKEYLTQRAIPDTDAECRWDWRYARCEPFCDCAFTPLLGDYHLGRSCRLVAAATEKEEFCHLPPTTPYSRIATKAMIRGRMAYHKARVTLGQVAHDSARKWEQIQEQACSCGDENLQDDTTGRLSTIKERLLCGPPEKRCNNEGINDTNFRNNSSRSDDDNHESYHSRDDETWSNSEIDKNVGEAEAEGFAEETQEQSPKEKLSRAKWMGLWT